MTGERRYLLDNRRSEAGERFDAMAELFDPVSVRHLAGLGVGAGWHCWEAGAGGPGVAAWMAEQVGPSGRVLATDLDVSWLPASGAFEVRRHDLVTEPPPGEFDVVHVRLVLVHLPERGAVLASLVAALRPGGWLLVEDADPQLQPLACPDESGPGQRLANRVRAAFRDLLGERGVDLAFGRTLPRLLREAGLADVGADAFFPVTSPACLTLEAATVRQLRDQLVASGRVTASEVDAHLANLAEGGMDVVTAPLVSAWGRRPATRRD